jgi:hypothetical protein
MALIYNQFGNLEPGFYDMEWDDFKEVFGFNEHRRWLLEGAELAIEDLRTVNCETIYMDGSFITKEQDPEDYDLCWDDTNIRLVEVMKKCYPLVDAGWKMSKIRARYRGDVAPANNIADMKKCINFLGYFTEDKQGRDKGIIRIKI